MKKRLTFPHEYNARNNPKLQNVLSALGLEGVGLYWCLIEQLYEQGGKIPISQYKCISFVLHLNYKCIERIINDFGLFETDGQYFWSNRVLETINQQVSISEKRKSAISKRWQKGTTDTNVIQLNNTCIEEKENKQEKEKFPPNNPLIKEKEINKEKELSQEKNLKQVLSEKEKKSTVFKPPTLEQVKARIAEKGYTVNAEQFIAFYQSKGWMIGKNKMKDWKAALVTWQKRENDKRQTTHYGTSADIEYERRQAEFRDYITQKLATPEVEPDISEFY